MFKLGGKTQVKAVVTKGTKCFSSVGGILVGAAAAVFLATDFINSVTEKNCQMKLY